MVLEKGDYIIMNRIIVFLILSLTSFFVNSADYNDLLFLKYKLGEYDKIIKSEDQRSLLYNGLLYEHSLISEDYSKAEYYYYKLKQPMKDKRIFLYCYLYCTSRLDDLFTEYSGTSKVVNFIYAIEKVSKGKECSDYINDESICNSVRFLILVNDEDDLNYYIATKFLEASNHDDDVYEIVYYLLKKSYLEGNEKSSFPLAHMHYWMKWAPRDCRKIKELVPGKEYIYNYFPECK